MAASSVTKPPSLLWEELRRAYRELRGSKSSPARAAAAVALGTFIGCIPIYGAHTPLVLALCLVLRLDGFLAWIAANISNPLFSVVLLTVEVQVGALLLDGRFFPMHDLEASLETGIVGFYGYALVGSPLVGMVLAGLLSAVTYLGMSLKRRFRPAEERPPYRLPDEAPAWWHLAERIAARFSPIDEDAGAAERSRFHYVRMKLIGDPVMKMIAERGDDEPFGDVLDVGTGRGQLPLILLELGRAGSVVGFDWDEDKIAAAQDAADQPPALNARFEVADMTDETTAFPASDTVLLVDVIHYLPVRDQNRVLARAAAAVRPGGRLLLREADTERGWRSAVTLAEERLFTALRFNRGAEVTFRPAREIVGCLEEAGLEVEVEPAWGSTPFSNVLIEARRPAEG